MYNLLNSGKFEVDFTTQVSSSDFMAICWERVEILIRIYLELGGVWNFFRVTAKDFVSVWMIVIDHHSNSFWRLDLCGSYSHSDAHKRL